MKRFTSFPGPLLLASPGCVQYGTPSSVGTHCLKDISFGQGLGFYNTRTWFSLSYGQLDDTHLRGLTRNIMLSRHLAREWNRASASLFGGPQRYTTRSRSPSNLTGADP